TTSMGDVPGGFTLPTTGSTVVGTYTWHANYTASDGTVTAQEQPPPQEQVTITPASPAVGTLANPTGTVQLGTGSVNLNDSATLSGGYFPGGTITFTLNAPGGALLYTDNVKVAGNGSYNTSTGDNPGGFTLPTNGTTVVGTYTWHANYNPDG